MLIPKNIKARVIIVGMSSRVPSIAKKAIEAATKLKMPVEANTRWVHLRHVNEAC